MSKNLFLGYFLEFTRINILMSSDLHNFTKTQQQNTKKATEINPHLYKVKERTDVIINGSWSIFLCIASSSDVDIHIACMIECIL